MVEPHLSAECGGTNACSAAERRLTEHFREAGASLERRKGGEKLVLKRGPTMAADPTAMLMALQSPGESPL